MASNFSRADGLTPIITFISMIVLGIVISKFIITKDSLQLPIILLFFFLGIVLAALELRATMGKKRMQTGFTGKAKLSDEEAKNRLAKYVADLFEEDIPFDELENERKRKLDELNEDQI